MDIAVSSISDYITLYGLKILAAVAIFFVGKWAAGLLTNLARKLMKRADVDNTLISFGVNIIYVLLMVFVVIAALSQLGVETTSLAAVIAAAGLAIGLALQGSLSNFAAGALIILFRPFRVGDYVEAAGTSGTVEEVSIFTTSLVTPDNKSVIVPNAQITGNNIINYSAKDTRRVDMVFGIGYGDDIKKAKQLLEKLLTADKRVLEDPAPVVAVSELADSSVNFVVRPWVKKEDYWDVKFEMTETIKLEFDKAGISIPFPQRDIHIHNHDALASANDDSKKKKAA